SHCENLLDPTPCYSARIAFPWHCHPEHTDSRTANYGWHDTTVCHPEQVHRAAHDARRRSTCGCLFYFLDSCVMRSAAKRLRWLVCPENKQPRLPPATVILTLSAEKWKDPRLHFHGLGRRQASCMTAVASGNRGLV